MSFTTNKFMYDANVADAPVQSIAAIMAKQGSKDNTVEIPNIITTESGQEKKEEPKAAQAEAPVETTNASPTTEEAKPESPTQSKEPEVVTPQKEETTKVPTLQEVLKSQQPDTVLKELGFDDKVVKLLNTVKENKQMQAFFDHWMNNGNVVDYLREMTIDYSKMSPEEVLRQQLRQEYPKASEKALNVLFKAEVLDKYKLDADTYSDEEIEDSRLLMEARADKYRDSLIASQQNFLIPKPPEPKAAEADIQQQQAIQELEEYKKMVSENDTVKNIIASNIITVGDGEDKFNLPLSEPKEVLDLLLDNDKWTAALKTKDGKFDIGKQLLVAAFAKDPQHFLKELAIHFRSLGGKKAIEPIESAKVASNDTPAKSDQAPSSPAAAMAKSGVVR